MTKVYISNQRKTGILGLSGVILFLLFLLFFGNLNSEFNFQQDYISKLGAIGQPNAIWWNLLGFGLVGLILIGFGFYYGKILNDKLAGLLLAMFGVGFAFTASPIDFIESKSPISKAHIVAICLALAFWLFGLARISYNPANKKSVKRRANITAILMVTSMVGFVLEFWSMPIAHRLVFAIVFGWTAITSIDLIKTEQKSILNLN